MTRITLALTLLLAAAIGHADQTLKTHWNKRLAYGFTYPASWRTNTDPGSDGSDSFSAYSPGSDANINIKVSRLPPDMRQYQSILDIPNVERDIQKHVRDELGAKDVTAGSTTLSNTEALWIKSFSVQRTLGREGWFSMYQLMCIRDGRLYTITTSALGRSQKEADKRFESYWPTFYESLMGFIFLQRQKIENSLPSSLNSRSRP